MTDPEEKFNTTNNFDSAMIHFKLVKQKPGELHRLHLQYKVLIYLTFITVRLLNLPQQLQFEYSDVYRSLEIMRKLFPPHVKRS